MNQLNGSMPVLPSTLTYFNASHDLFTGNLTIPANIATVDVSFNTFNGTLNVTGATTYLDASNNQFTSISIKYPNQYPNQLTFCNLTNNPKLGASQSNLNACIFNTSQPLVNPLVTSIPNNAGMINFISTISNAGTQSIQIISKYSSTGDFTASTSILDNPTTMFQSAPTSSTSFTSQSTSILHDLLSNSTNTSQFYQIPQSLQPDSIQPIDKSILTRIIHKSTISPISFQNSTKLLSHSQTTSTYISSTIPIKLAHLSPNTSHYIVNISHYFRIFVNFILFIFVIHKTPKNYFKRKKEATSHFYEN
eukprot:NODE_257_length_11653_cov_0.298858.p5 type:complete len:307 gc:universal NODE_257_length_11653_cov_0.298858:2076-2996(+)